MDNKLKNLSPADLKAVGDYVIEQIENKEIGYSVRAKINANAHNLKKDVNNRATKEELERVEQDFKDATTNFKGYFPTSADLGLAYPQADNKKGWFAWVGSPHPGTVCTVSADGSPWFNTGEAPPVNEVELDEYAKNGGSEKTLQQVDDKVEVILSNGVYTRVNSGESTNTPQYFKQKTASTGTPAIDIIADVESPFKEVLPYKRVMNYTLPGEPTAVFALDSIHVDANRPSTMTFSYWMKEVEVRAIWIDMMEVYLALGSYKYNVINLLNNIGTKQTITVTPNISQYSKGVLTAYFSEKKDGFVKLVQEFEIEWKADFSGTSIPYYFIYNNVINNLRNNPLSIYNFTILFEAINDGVQIYADPNNLFPQSPNNLSSLQGQIDLANQEVIELWNAISENAQKGAKVSIINDILYFASPFSETKELVRSFQVNRGDSFTSNPNVNMWKTTLINKGASLDGGTLLKDSGDDICPANLNGSYIGGNHGWNQSRGINLPNHGKTYADIGSQWKDANNIIFVILRIVDANNMWMVSKNQATDGYSYSFASPNGTLIHVDGAVNTSDIAGYTLFEVGNLYTTVKENKFKIFIDGKVELLDNDLHNCDFIDIVEDYDAFDLPSTIEKLIANKPTGGYTNNVILNNLGANKLINHTITYRILSNGTTLIFHNFFAYRKLSFNFHGFIQATNLPNGKLYIPKTKPISDDVKTFNFNAIETWSGGAKALYLTPVYWELANNPPDRILNLNDSVNFHLGYLFDRGVGLQRKAEMLDRAMFLNTNGKLYPFGVHKPMPMEANSFLSCVCFRQWTNPNNNPLGRTNYSWFELDRKVYIYLDYHKTISDTIEMPLEWIGKKIVVAEKTDNVIILGNVTSNELRIICTIDNDNVNGYAVLVLE